MQTHTQTQTWAFFVMTAYCLSDHCCINVFRMSWVRVRFSGTMAWLTHARTLSLFVSLFLSLSNTHTDSTHFSYWLSFIRFLCKPGCSPNYHLSTLHYTWHPFNIKLLQAMFKTIRNLNMHYVVPLWASGWQPEEKFSSTAIGWRVATRDGSNKSGQSELCQSDETHTVRAQLDHTDTLNIPLHLLKMFVLEAWKVIFHELCFCYPVLTIFYEFLKTYLVRIFCLLTWLACVSSEHMMFP